MSFRDELFSFLESELVGPRPGLPFVQLNREEVLAPEDTPRLRYGAGILFPARLDLAEQEDDGEAADVTTGEHPSQEGVDANLEATGGSDVHADARGEGQSETDQELNRTNEYLPSALGLTALVEVPEMLRIRVDAAQYSPEELEGEGYRDRNGQWKPARYWFRRPIRESIVLERAELLSGTVTKKDIAVHNTGTRLELHIFVRKPATRWASEAPNRRFMTFTLINRTPPSERPRDEDCFFQCGLTVDAEQDVKCFLEYPESRAESAQDHEAASLCLLYRHRKVFAVGHGCSSDWEGSESIGTARVWTSTMPKYEVPPIVPSSLDGIKLEMRHLSSVDDGALAQCKRLADGYERWIECQDEQLRAVDGLPAAQLRAGQANIGECRARLSRIRSGLQLLETNDVARRAFALMNHAMIMQHLHYELATSGRRTWQKSGPRLTLEKRYEAPDYKESTRTWRPFQLAFILSTIRSIVLEDEGDHDERRIVDLIWFPTGGGKTEAYLGVIAFAIFFRRLTHPENGGTAALMRYTLRLLTTQQFQRAASLICACENIRRGDVSGLGTQPVTIGLWVGGSVTPNSERSAEQALDKLLHGDRENPFIVLSCPWCGAEMGPVKDGNHVRAKGYRKLSSPKRVRLVCEDPDCEFNSGEGLPLQIIDEDIYARPPTLIVGTVDKFALLPWYPAAKSLFGIGTGGNITPPDLIVQDELHLISGPLGSMVGHYETVIDALCTRMEGGRSVSAKIIASTATIARAPEQVSALYGGRKSSLFPPQALRAGDSYFAEERPVTNDVHGRLYVGVFASGLPSQTTTELRVLSSLLQGAALIPTRQEGQRDPYWTLMVYFNSIRELGHAATLLKADIPEYNSVTWKRLGLDGRWGDDAASRRRFINQDMELTSRVQNSEITECMDRLSAAYPWTGSGPRPVDACLATNMIQVGLDVQRLSLMAIVGQPKTTSEYIQASSRVGRSLNPGLVATILSPSKPRDRSHFEHFKAYHQSIYRYVEPTSVTPFAVPVSQRAIHALVVTLARYWGNEEQCRYPNPPDAALERRIRQTVMDRVTAVDVNEVSRVSRRLDEIFREWRRLPPDTYGTFKLSDDQVPFMYPSGTNPGYDWDERAYPTPSSMRSVDANCQAEVLGMYPALTTID